MSIATGKGPPVWAIDVDGVLARFNEAALMWLNNYTGAAHTWAPASGPTAWNWPREMFGRKAEDALWDMVAQNPRWWLSLNPYNDALAFLTDITRRREQERLVPYFVTSRPPNHAARSTQLWLSEHGLGEMPNVIVTQPGKKHLVLEAIGAEVLVDDYAENFRNLPLFTRGYLVDRPWNRGLGQSGVLRVQSPLDVFVREAAYRKLKEGYR